jgi:hypothetical protein
LVTMRSMKSRFCFARLGLLGLMFAYFVRCSSDAGTTQNNPSGLDGSVGTDAGLVTSPDASPVDAATTDAASTDSSPAPINNGPTFWAGAFLTGAGDDTENLTPMLRARLGRPLPVEQTYRSTSTLGVSRIASDLEKLYARGTLPHLYIEPKKSTGGGTAEYTAAQYENLNVDPEIGAGIDAAADEVANALAKDSKRSLLFSFGAEMNASWTPWGCRPASFRALHTRMHTSMKRALLAKGVDPTRVRWLFAPDSRGTTKKPDGSACDNQAKSYFPGWEQSNYLGISAYRQGTENQSVRDAVLAPCEKLLNDLGVPADQRDGRLVVLQAGAKNSPTRPDFVRDLHKALSEDPIYAGVIWFNALEHALVDRQGNKNGGKEWLDALAAYPGRPDVLVTRHYADVGPTSAYYNELQTIGDLGFAGCGSAPTRFCPNAELTRAQAASFLARAFGVAPASPAPLSDVPTDHPNAGDIAALLARSALEPCRSGAFCPNDTLLAGDLTKALTVLDGKSVASLQDPVLRGQGAATIILARPKP